MQALQRTIQQIGAQLKGLPNTAKMLIGSLMIILVMSLFLVSLYAGKPSMVSLGLGSNLSQDAKAKAVNFLNGRNIAYEDKNGDLLVPAEQKYPVLAQLSENNLINADQIDFQKLVSDMSPFMTQGQNRQRYLVAKMNVLANMIGQMSGVEKATVVIDVPEGASGIGRANVSTTASVNVIPRGGELSQSQVDAIANLVAGAHAGLRPENVAVIDARTQRSLKARTGDSMVSTRYLEVKLAAEKVVRQTLEGALAYIPRVTIAVNAQVDTKEVLSSKSTYDDPKVGPLAENNRTTTSNNQSGGTEPGMRTNTGVSIAAATGRGSTMSDERTDSKTVPAFGKDERQIRDSKGYPLQINASIGVPRSYFVRLYQETKGGDDKSAAPDPAALDVFVQTESDRIQKSVAPLIDTQAIEGTTAGTVTVSMFPDFAMAGGTGSGGSGGGGGGGGTSSAGESGGDVGSSLVSDGLVKYVSLGGLAIVSLGMMFMMVRKASVREQLPSAQELVGIPPALAAAESDLVGEADEAAPALEGLELDDKSIRRQQMLSQITDMVNETPDEAAGLLRRWIKSEA